MGRIDKIIKDSEKFDSEEDQWNYIETEILKISDSLTAEEMGRFIDQTLKGIKKFSKKVDKFIEKQKRKTKQ